MNRSTRTLTAVFGALAGCAGLEHGIGEILQGPGAAPGIFFTSWLGIAGSSGWWLVSPRCPCCPDC